MNKLIKSLPENVKQTLSALIPLIIVIILFVVVGKFGVSKIISLRAEIASANKIEKVLTQKLKLLQAFSSDTSLKSSVVTSALPDTNSSLTVISQLKNVALGNGVVLSTVKSSTGGANSGALRESVISFTVDGARSQVFSFLKGVSGIAPITTVDKIRISETAGSVRADISVKSYWSDLPKNIPSVTTPIVDLTTAERETLVAIANLTQPAFIEITPSQGGTNPNPFGE